MSATYGIDVRSTDDPFFRETVDASHVLMNLMTPGKFLADIVPISG